MGRLKEGYKKFTATVLLTLLLKLFRYMTYLFTCYFCSFFSTAFQKHTPVVIL